MIQKKLVGTNISNDVYLLLISESPVPLEFTPVLGILVGVVLTLMLVAFVVILVLRLKYQTNKTKNNDRANNRKQNQQNNKNKQERTKANNTASAIPNDKDAEEYYCMSLADENKSDTTQRQVSYKNDTHLKKPQTFNSAKYRQGNVLVQQEINPDVIPNRHKAQVTGQLNQQKHNGSGKLKRTRTGARVSLDIMIRKICEFKVGISKFEFFYNPI